MSINQLHGKKFEDFIKSLFPGASDYKRTYNSFWDIENNFDKEFKLPTSIKSSSTNIICLADARRFFLVKQPYRLLCGIYIQKDEIKEFNSLYEFFITEDEHKKLCGDISFEEVNDFHESLLKFKIGSHDLARKYAKERIQEFKSRSMITLNPKIDNKTQRRLQCSIKIPNLLENVKTFSHFQKEKGDFYKNTDVFIKFKSSRREFNKNIK